MRVKESRKVFRPSTAPFIRPVFGVEVGGEINRPPDGAF